MQADAAQIAPGWRLSSGLAAFVMAGVACLACGGTFTSSGGGSMPAGLGWR